MPPFGGSRTVAAVWLLASMVFMSSYSGILTAMLTVPRVTIPIDSVEDLVAQDDLPWTVENSSIMHQYYQVTDGYMDLWEGMTDAESMSECGDKLPVQTPEYLPKRIKFLLDTLYVKVINST